MLPDLTAAMAAEHQRDLHDAADRYRLAAAAVSPAALRLRLGRLVSRLASLSGG